MDADAIVVGGGIVGAACARELARGGMHVIVLEARTVGCAATAAGMGHIVVMDDSPDQLALTAYSVALWRELALALPSAAEYDACGTLWLAEDGAQMDAVREKQRAYEAHGIEAEIVDQNRLAELEPNLRRGLEGGLRVTGDAVVYSPRAAVAIIDEARSRGADVREHARVERIEDGTAHVDGKRVRAPVIVNAAGLHASSLVPDLPIVPRKGHLAITDRAPGFVKHQLVELGYLTSAHVMTSESVAFNVQPRRTGQVLIGSSRELVGWDDSTNRPLLQRMLARALEFMPSLAALNVTRTWTGFRPATPDKLPLIGAWPAIPGLWIAAGHEGLGITTSLGTAHLLADLILGRTPALDGCAFRPDRAMARA